MTSSIAGLPSFLWAALFLIGACGSKSSTPSGSDGSTTVDARVDAPAPVPDGASKDGTAAPDAESDPEAGAAVDTSAAAPVAPLAPVSAATGRALGAYARRLQTVSYGVGPRPTAWSMVNASCQDRAMVLEYVIASAPMPLPAAPPTLIDTEITEAGTLAVVAHPSFPVGTINVTGPLVTRQTLILPDGKPAPGDPDFYYWPYHHGAVLNVDGELRVFDLSMGDEPVAIDTWLSGFVAPGTQCARVTEDEHQRIWIYWNARFGNLTPDSVPPRLCGYTITPLFTMRWDQSPQDLAEMIRSLPFTMQVQTGSLVTTLDANHSTTVPEADLPMVTSRYQPGTIADVCERVWMEALCGEAPDGGSGDARVR